MPPHFSREKDEILYLHPDLGKLNSKTRIFQPHVFQQSITLTASMWDKSASDGNMDNGNFNSWRIFSEQSPLLAALFCGFGIVLLIMSTVVIWRYCWLSKSKKLCCESSFEGKNIHVEKNSLPTVKKVKENDEFVNLQSELKYTEKNSTLKHSLSVGSLPQSNSNIEITTATKCGTPLEEDFRKNKINSNLFVELTQFEPLITQDDYYLPNLHASSLDKNYPEMSKHLSWSTPPFEELYAKVNFSKKIKNRMRKDDAAVIAMSKSTSVQHENLLLSSPAIVVYNERTAL